MESSGEALHDKRLEGRQSLPEIENFFKLKSIFW